MKKHLFVSWLGIHQTSCYPYFYFCKTSRKTDDVIHFQDVFNNWEKKISDPYMLYTQQNSYGFVAIFWKSHYWMFFCYVIFDVGRDCVFLSFWRFSNVSDLSYKPYTAGKAWCWGKNMIFFDWCAKVCVHVCICVYVYICIYMYVCLLKREDIPLASFRVRGV